MSDISEFATWEAQHGSQVELDALEREERRCGMAQKDREANSCNDSRSSATGDTSSRRSSNSSSSRREQTDGGAQFELPARTANGRSAHKFEIPSSTAQSMSQWQVCGLLSNRMRREEGLDGS